MCSRDSCVLLPLQWHNTDRQSRGSNRVPEEQRGNKLHCTNINIQMWQRSICHRLKLSLQQRGCHFEAYFSSVVRVGLSFLMNLARSLAFVHAHKTKKLLQGQGQTLCCSVKHTHFVASGFSCLMFNTSGIASGKTRLLCAVYRELRHYWEKKSLMMFCRHM